MPEEKVTLTIRLIKSFEYRISKNLILRDVSVNTTISTLMALIQGKIKNEAAFKRFRINNYDTLKLFMKAHGAKTSNLIINLERDSDWILSPPSSTLRDFQIDTESEISFFNRAEYESFKAHPEVKW